MHLLEHALKGFNVFFNLNKIVQITFPCISKQAVRVLAATGNMTQVMAYQRVSLCEKNGKKKHLLNGIPSMHDTG